MCTPSIEVNPGILLPFSPTAPGGLVLECSPGVQEVAGSIPNWVIPKIIKMALGASLQSVQH